MESQSIAQILARLERRLLRMLTKDEPPFARALHMQLDREGGRGAADGVMEKPPNDCSASPAEPKDR